MLINFLTIYRYLTKAKSEGTKNEGNNGEKELVIKIVYGEYKYHLGSVKWGAESCSLSYYYGEVVFSIICFFRFSFFFFYLADRRTLCHASSQGGVPCLVKILVHVAVGAYREEVQTHPQEMDRKLTNARSWGDWLFSLPSAVFKRI